MKKKYLFLLSALLVVVLSMGGTSCSDDDDDGLTGWWMSETWVAWTKLTCSHALHFVDENVVDYYITVYNGKASDDDIPFPGKEGWYYSKNGVTRYNYLIENNILYLYNANNNMMINFFGGSPEGYTKVK